MTKRDKLNRLAKAANNLRSAADSLRQIAQDPSNGWYLCPDAHSLLNQVNEILSSDHGQAGLDALISTVARELEA